MNNRDEDTTMTGTKNPSGLTKQFVMYDLILAQGYAEEAARFLNILRLYIEQAEDRSPGIATALLGEIKLAFEKSDTFRDRIRELAEQL